MQERLILKRIQLSLTFSSQDVCSWILKLPGTGQREILEDWSKHAEWLNIFFVYFPSFKNDHKFQYETREIL